MTPGGAVIRKPTKKIPKGWFIVKVQVSRYTTERKRQVLIYNKDKSVHWMGDASKDVLREMKKRDKAFFYAEIVKTKIEIKVNRGEEAPWQDW